MTRPWAPDVPPGWWLRVAEAVYLLGLRIHDLLYSSGILRSAFPQVPAVSVGNITVGGTGKTPCVIWLARALSRHGERPVVLSRGYGRRHREIIMLEPGRPVPTADQAGDEPLEISEAAAVPVVIGRTRQETARIATERLSATCLVLDDAFQHRPLKRDFDLVLLDHGSPFGNGHLLPAGPLREPVTALARAQAILLTRAGERGIDDVPEALRRLAPKAPVGSADHVPAALLALDDATDRRVPSKADRVFLTAGVARPDSFESSAGQWGLAIAGTKLFRDHFPYTSRERDLVQEAAGSLPIVTTRKDAMRWRQVPGLERSRWFVLTMEFRPRDEETLLSLILGAIREARERRGLESPTKSDAGRRDLGKGGAIFSD